MSGIITSLIYVFTSCVMLFLSKIAFCIPSEALNSNSKAVRTDVYTQKYVQFFRKFILPT